MQKIYIYIDSNFLVTKIICIRFFLDLNHAFLKSKSLNNKFLKKIILIENLNAKIIFNEKNEF